MEGPAIAEEYSSAATTESAASAATEIGEPQIRLTFPKSLMEFPNRMVHATPSDDEVNKQLYKFRLLDEHSQKLKQIELSSKKPKLWARMQDKRIGDAIKEKKKTAKEKRLREAEDDPDHLNKRLNIGDNPASSSNQQDIQLEQHKFREQTIAIQRKWNDVDAVCNYLADVPPGELFDCTFFVDMAVEEFEGLLAELEAIGNIEAGQIVAEFLKTLAVLREVTTS